MKFWAEDGTPLDFGHELFDDDLDRIMENVMRAIDRVPAAAEAGVKRVINGPMIWSQIPTRCSGRCRNSPTISAATASFPASASPEGWPAGRAMDDRGRAGMGHVRPGSCPLRRLGGQGLHQGAGARPVYPSFQDHFPNEERSAGRPARTRPIPQTQRDSRELSSA